MIITIQHVNKIRIIRFGRLEIIANSMTVATRLAAMLVEKYFRETGVRPTIKILPIIHTPMEKTYYALYTKRGNLSVLCEKLPIYWFKKVAIEQASIFKAIVKKVSVTVNPVEDVTNYNQPMATKTPPAKKAKALKKLAKKKVVKKVGKK